MQIGLLDEFSKTKMKIVRNLAVAQFKLHDYYSALFSFKTIMAAEPSSRIGFSIVLCHCLLQHESEELRDAFSELVHVELKVRLALGFIILSTPT